MDNYEKLKELILSVEEDAVKFFQKGNGSAGGRIRKAMQEIKKMAQNLRVQVQDLKKESAEAKKS